MNILWVSIAFPPKNNPECLQAGKYFKYLAKQPNFDISVLTSSSPTLFMPYDASLQIDLSAVKEYIEILIPENKYINFLLRKVNQSLMELPDSKFLFHTQWRKAAKKLRQKPDLIYSRAFPLSSSIMALKLVKKFNIPWVMHLSDPWVDNPLEKRGKLAQRINKNWEKECFQLASFITLTSNQTVDLYRGKYPEFSDKFIFMPNVYDPKDINQDNHSLKLGDKLHFVYTGGLIETRTAEPLFKALKILQEKNSGLLDEITVSFAGQFDRKNIALFNQYKLPCIQNFGLLSYSDAIKLQKDAHVLLAFDSPATSAETALFFPSKLLDYIASKKKILAVTDTGSTTWSVIQDKYGDCVSHDQIQKLSDTIFFYLQQYKNGNASYFINEIKDETFSASFNASRLAILFKETINRQM